MKYKITIILHIVNEFPRLVLFCSYLLCMNRKRHVLTFLTFLLIGHLSSGQCTDIAIADSSFEAGTFTTSGSINPPQGIWYRDDGCDVFAGGYAGDSAACSNGGGGYQYVSVDSNTTYHLSCWIRNGLNDPMLIFRINWNSYPISTSSNDWTFVSQSFNSGSDTVAVVGFYSGGACFDLFRLTCSPITGQPGPSSLPRPFSIFPSISQNAFTFSSSRSCRLEVLDLQGNLLENLESKGGKVEFGTRLPAGVYILQIQSDKALWREKVVKL